MSFLLSIPNDDAFSVLSNHLPEEMRKDLPTCIGVRRGVHPDHWDINPGLTLYIAAKMQISPAEAEQYIRNIFKPIKIPSFPRGMWRYQVHPDDVHHVYEMVRKMYNGEKGGLSRTDQFQLWILYANLIEDFGNVDTYFENYHAKINRTLRTSHLLVTNFLTTDDKYLLLSILVFLSVFIFLQVFFVQDVLLLFVVMDLALSVFAVLFSLTGLFNGDLFSVAFFFILLTLAACETAISLGFLVSFSRRHKSASLTLSSLRYATL